MWVLNIDISLYKIIFVRNLRRRAEEQLLNVSAKEYGERQQNIILSAQDDELVYLALFWINGLSVNGGSEYEEDYYAICKKLEISNPKEYFKNWAKFEFVGILEQDGGSEYVSKIGSINIEKCLSDPRVKQIFDFVKDADRKWKGY